MNGIQLKNGTEKVSPIVTTQYIQTTDGVNIEEKIDKKMDKNGGIFEGVLKANSNTQYTTSQVRNITLSTETPTASQGNNGDIWIVY